MTGHQGPHTGQPRKGAPDVVDTPCKGKEALFDSTDLNDHREAAALCVTCPGRQLCLAAAQLEMFAEGTHGGVLFVNGERRSP